MNAEQQELLPAFLTVLKAAPGPWRTSIGIMGLSVLGDSHVIRCHACPQPAPLSFTGCVKHLRDYPDVEHDLRFDPTIIDETIGLPAHGPATS